MTPQQEGEELGYIHKWETRGLKFTRRDGNLQRDRNGTYHIRARLMTDYGCGLAVGFMLFDAQNRRNPEPWQIQFGKQIEWFGDQEVRKALLLEYLFRTKGAFGSTPWIFVAILAAMCVGLSVALWWVGPAVFLAFLIFTYGNFKLWFR